RLGQWQPASEHLEEGLRVAGQLLASRPAEAAESQVLIRLHRDLGDIARGSGDAAAAIPHDFLILETALQWNRKHPDPVSRAFVAMGYTRTSEGLQGRGDLAAALQHAREEVAIYEELAAARPDNRGDQRSLAIGYERLGTVLNDPLRLSLEDPGAALPYFQKALKIYDQLASADPTNIMPITDLTGGLVYVCIAMADQRMPGAIEICRRGIDISVARDNPPIYRGLLLTAAGLAGQNVRRLPEAESYYQQAIDYERRMFADRPNEVNHRHALMRALLGMARLQLEKGDRPGALELCREA